MTTSLSTLATDLLDIAVGALVNPPARQFVAHGFFAHDCELVAVHLEALDLEPQGVGACAFYPTARYAVTVLRCYPSMDDHGTPPTAAALTAASGVLQDDAWHLTTEMVAAFLAGSLGVDCDRLSVLPGLEPVGPSGVVAGWRWRASIGF